MRSALQSEEWEKVALMDELQKELEKMERIEARLEHDVEIGVGQPQNHHRRQETAKRKLQEARQGYHQKAFQMLQFIRQPNTKGGTRLPKMVENSREMWAEVKKSTIWQGGIPNWDPHRTDPKTGRNPTTPLYAMNKPHPIGLRRRTNLTKNEEKWFFSLVTNAMAIRALDFYKRGKMEEYQKMISIIFNIPDQLLWYELPNYQRTERRHKGDKKAVAEAKLPSLAQSAKLILRGYLRTVRIGEVLPRIQRREMKRREKKERLEREQKEDWRREKREKEREKQIKENGKKDDDDEEEEVGWMEEKEEEWTGAAKRRYKESAEEKAR